MFGLHLSSTLADDHYCRCFVRRAAHTLVFENKGLKTFSLAQQTSSLYPRIVGPAWANLSEPVQRLHAGALQGAGKFTVRHGERGTARLLVRLLRLPAAGVDIPVKLSVTTHKSGERWHRTFGGGTPFVTEQRAGESGLMIERIGRAEVCYRLEIVGGALFYRQTGTKLCIGPLRLPLPRWLAPRIAARESALPEEKSTHISVEVSLPLIGRLIAYKGFIKEQG